MAVPPRTSLAWQNIAKKLPLRAVLFDARCIMRTAAESDAATNVARQKALQQAGLGHAKSQLRSPEQILKEGRVKDMLQSELRAELKRRGQPATGKPWELRARLTALLEAEVVGVRPAAATSSTPPVAANSPLPASSATDSGGVKRAGGAGGAGGAGTLPFAVGASAAEKRSAYADKLRLRVGASLSKDGTIAATGQTKAPTPDHIRPPGGLDWHLQPGARDLLTYLDMRGILRVLLPSPDADSDEKGAAEAERLARALQVPPFAFVLDRAEADLLRSGDAAPLSRTHAVLSLGVTSELMLVTDDRAAVRAAKEARIFTCHVRARPITPGITSVGRRPARSSSHIYAGAPAPPRRAFSCSRTLPVFYVMMVASLGASAVCTRGARRTKGTADRFPRGGYGGRAARD